MALQPEPSSAPLSTDTITNNSQQPVNLPAPASLKRKDHDDDDDDDHVEEDEEDDEHRRLKRQRLETFPTITPPARRAGRTLTGRKSVDFAAARRTLRDLQTFKHLDDLLAFAPDATFDIARKIVDNHYHYVNLFKSSDFIRYTPVGMDLVGRVGLFIVPVLRGDPRPPSPDNKQTLPGPCNTHVMVKITPGLVCNNDHHEHMNIKIFTTKHNTDPNKLHNSGELERDFVLMRRTPGDSVSSVQTCFASLNFVGTSKTYEYKTPCYMSVDGVQTYPRRCPWMDLGYLAGPVDHITLHDILHEASTRLAAPNLRKISDYAPAGFQSPPPTLSSKLDTSHGSLKSSAAPSQGQELDTVVSKTRPLPIETNAEPLLPAGDTAASRLPPNISDLTVIEFYRNKDLSQADIEAMQRLQSKNYKTS